MEKASPTRMHLLRLRGQRGVAERGLSLLRSKREALIREFFGVIDQAVSRRDLLEQAMQGATRALAVAVGMDGRAAVASAGFAAWREIPLTLTEKNIWGIRFSEVSFQTVARAADARGYALSGVSSHTDAAARQFEQAVDAALRVVSVEVKLEKIGEEIRKATRRINALTEILLPDLQHQIATIRLALEESERGEIFRMKRLKGRQRGGAR